MKYIVESFYDDAKVTVETNDVEVAILEMISRDSDEVHAHCFSGETGEILAIVNCPTCDNYITPEFALMSVGVLMKIEEEMEEESEEVTGADLVMALISDLAEQGKLVQ